MDILVGCVGSDEGVPREISVRRDLIKDGASIIDGMEVDDLGNEVTEVALRSRDRNVTL